MASPFEAFIFESEGSSVFPSFYVDDFEVIGEAATSSSSSSSSSSGGGAMNIAKNGDVEADTANWLPAAPPLPVSRQNTTKARLACWFQTAPPPGRAQAFWLIT